MTPDRDVGRPPSLKIPGGLLRDLLQEGETLVRVAPIHPGIYWKSVVLFLIGVFLLIPAFNLGVFFLFVSLIAFVFAWLTKHYLLLAITDRRTIIRHGIVHLDVIQIRHSRVESVEIARSLTGRILGYATVLITGTGSRITAVPYVADAGAFRDDLDQILYEREERHAGG